MEQATLIMTIIQLHYYFNRTGYAILFFLIGILLNKRKLRLWYANTIFNLVKNIIFQLKVIDDMRKLLMVKCNS